MVRVEDTLEMLDGLPSAYAESMLRLMDADGKVGIQSTPDELLREAVRRTQGNPHRLKILVWNTCRGQKDDSSQPSKDRH